MEVHAIVTEDRVGLQLAWLPPTEQKSPVLLATHGVGNSFTASALWRVCELLNARGWGVAMVNNRGHDWVAMNPVDKRWMGAAYERIEDSALDFRAALAWLQQRGHDRVVISGHSLGGLKAAYTQAFYPNPQVVALAMFSSPRLPDDKVWDWPAHEKLLAHCRSLVEQGRGEELLHVEMPTNTPAMRGLMCARTYINKYGPDAATTTLRFADRIRVPTLLLAGELEKPQLSFSVDMEPALVNAPSVRREAIAGADHIYSGCHEAVALAADRWLATLRQPRGA